MLLHGSPMDVDEGSSHSSHHPPHHLAHSHSPFHHDHHAHSHPAHISHHHGGGFHRPRVHMGNQTTNIHVQSQHHDPRSGGHAGGSGAYQPPQQVYSGRYYPRNPSYRLSRDELREIASETLHTLDRGYYYPPGGPNGSGAGADPGWMSDGDEEQEEEEETPKKEEGDGLAEDGQVVDLIDENKEEDTPAGIAPEAETANVQDSDQKVTSTSEDAGKEAAFASFSPPPPVPADLPEPEPAPKKVKKVKPVDPRVKYDLGSKIHLTNQNTLFIPPDDEVLSQWADIDLNLGLAEAPTPTSEKVTDSGGLGKKPSRTTKTKLVIGEYSTLVGTRKLHSWVEADESVKNKTIGVLNFASAKKPGGGFINGAQAQEESIARTSTLYPSLLAPQSKQFYMYHANDPDNAYYTHAMIYSPSVILFRDDRGLWKAPIAVDILTSAAVNAGDVRKQVEWEEEMREIEERVRVAELERRRELEREGERRRWHEERRKRLLEIEEEKERLRKDIQSVESRDGVDIAGLGGADHTSTSTDNLGAISEDADAADDKMDVDVDSNISTRSDDGLSDLSASASASRSVSVSISDRESETTTASSTASIIGEDSDSGAGSYTPPSELDVPTPGHIDGTATPAESDISNVSNVSTTGSDEQTPGTITPVDGVGKIENKGDEEGEGDRENVDEKKQEQETEPETLEDDGLFDPTASESTSRAPSPIIFASDPDPLPPSGAAGTSGRGFPPSLASRYSDASFAHANSQYPTPNVSSAMFSPFDADPSQVDNANAPAGTAASGPTPLELAEMQITAEMRERIARVLMAFYLKGARHLILGSFGTGVFQNSIEMVAGLFRDLLVGDGDGEEAGDHSEPVPIAPDGSDSLPPAPTRKVGSGKFRNAFDTVVFAILGGSTVRTFQQVFEGAEGYEFDDTGEGSDFEGMKDLADRPLPPPPTLKLVVPEGLGGDADDGFDDVERAGEGQDGKAEVDRPATAKEAASEANMEPQPEDNATSSQAQPIAPLAGVDELEAKIQKLELGTTQKPPSSD